MTDSAARKDARSSWDHGGPAPGSLVRPHIDASTTVNPFPSPDLVTLLAETLGEARDYPDPFSWRPREALSRKYHLDPERIVVGGGATVLLYALVRDPSVRRLLLFEPVFSEYERAALAAGLPVVRIPPELPLCFMADSHVDSLPATRWGIDPESVHRIKVRTGDVAVLVNPVNPTGQEFSTEQVRAFGAAISTAGAALLVDESFQDFIDNRSSVLSAAGEDGLSVLRSMTKISGLPGLRTGVLAGPTRLVDRIRSSLGPWATGTLEQRLMEWASRQHRASDFGWKEEAKEVLITRLLRAGIPCLPGAGPLIFARPRWRGSDGKRAREALMRQGIQIRLGNGFGPEDGEQFIRLGFEAFLKGDLLVEAIRKFSRL